MEIKAVKKSKIKYPKLINITKENLKENIPNKWLKAGINSFFFDFLFCNEDEAKKK